MLTPLSQEAGLSEIRFSKEAIERQLQKIIRDPIFESSDILKRFLSFIVGETLGEHSNRLKEYTIAVNVLNKPADFKPQESGIVRIHAGRLRRALNYYYGERGTLDNIRISIPKGSYVPVFNENDESFSNRTLSSRKPVVVGVAPFEISFNSSVKNSFADGLGSQLSTALMGIENFSVISYYAMRNLFSKPVYLEQIASIAGAQFLITGDIQILKGNLRLHMQMIRIRTGHLAWSQMYERKFTQENIFEVQDDIVKNIISELGSLAF
ncbi:MAG TPA: hypothetical protein VMI12_12165 [Puia sp.]|nr:hypothetical protein [Puia sp.]